MRPGPIGRMRFLMHRARSAGTSPACGRLLSFAWILKCSVRLTMRSVRIEIWTSGLPVSPSLRAFSEITTALRSAVIVILNILRHRHVEAAHHPDLAINGLDQRNGDVPVD